VPRSLPTSAASPLAPQLSARKAVFVDHLLSDLTPAQCEAVTHVDGPMLVLAGPGSGKTRVITHRVAYLIREGIPQSQILAVTFTNKAADEMATRIDRLVRQQTSDDALESAADPWASPPDAAPDESRGHAARRGRLWVSTFHRFCARMLRMYAPLVGIEANFAIYDAEDSRRVLRRAMEEADLGGVSITPEAVGATVSAAKNSLLGAADYQPRPGEELDAVVARVYPTYEQFLRQSNAVDFDDLLLLTAHLLRDNPEVRATLDDRFRYVLVDEYQDTNLAQFAIVRAVSLDYPNLAVTGDPDQSIYGWRGANLRNILEFELAYPDVKVIRLEQNYRSTQKILQVAAELIRYNIRRKEKALFTYNDEGCPARLTRYGSHEEEAVGIAETILDRLRNGRRRPRDFAIFYRTNALSRPLEFALRERGIPYQLVRGLEFFQRKEIKDILAYLRLLANPADEAALLRIINTPTRGIGAKTIERLRRHAPGKGLLQAAREVESIDEISSRSAKAVRRFVEMLDRLVQHAGGPLEELVGLVLSESGYQEQLRNSENEADEQRLANIEELLTVARNFDEQAEQDDSRWTSRASGLEGFLEEMALVGDTDDPRGEGSFSPDGEGDGDGNNAEHAPWDGAGGGRVMLMTLHAAKGLEFPVVFITAVEEGLLPHERSRHIPSQMEEERRLLFVGMTRAQEELYLSFAAWRDFRGQRRMTIPSPFLMELPRDGTCLQVVDPDGEPQWFDDFTLPVPEANSRVAGSRVTGSRAARSRGADSPSAEPARAASQALPSTKSRAADPSLGDAPRSASSTGKGSLAGLPLTTAAAMAGQREPDAPSPDDFRQDMVVWHASDGIGRIVALSGRGDRRTATVVFASAAGRRKVRLADGEIRPLERSGPTAPS